MQYYHKEYMVSKANQAGKANHVNKANIKQSNKNKIEQTPAPIQHYKDKWHQLLKDYPEVHITPNAQSILIKPKDIIILNEAYHNLSTNSFLLHSYYNYRQLLLLRYNTGDYYIGVPGIYCQRQEKLAKLFGFEAFEGEAGQFGYFLKKVEI